MSNGTYYDPDASWQSWGHGRSPRRHEPTPWVSPLTDEQRTAMRALSREESRYCHAPFCGLRHRPSRTACMTVAALQETAGG